MTKRRIDRRSFLRHAGLGLGSVWLGSNLLPSQVLHANPPEGPPLRLIQVFTRWGLETKALRMAPAGAPPSLLAASDWRRENSERPDPESWEIDLTRRPREQWASGLRPLYELRDKVLHIDGLCQSTAYMDRFGDSHAKSHAATATGVPAAYELAERDTRSWCSSPSVAWRITQHLRAQDPSLTDLAQLNIDVETRYQDEANAGGLLHFFWGQDTSGTITQEPAERDPRALFDAMFAGRSMEPTETPEGLAAHRERVLQLAESRYAALAGRVSGPDAGRLEQHRAILADLRTRFGRLDELSCVEPERMERLGGAYRIERSIQYQQHLDAFNDLIVAALSCGLTRVVGMQLPDPPPDVIGADLPGLYHLVYSHGAGPGREFHEPDSPTHQEWRRTQPTHAEKTRHQAEVIAALARRLDAIPEGEGTLLDNTMIVWMDEIAHGGHQYDMYPVTIVGGSSRFRTGRYVRLPRTLPSPGSGWKSREIIGPPLTRLQVTLCQEMGMELEHLSETTRYSGQLPDGTEPSVNLGGRLDALY